MHQITVTVDLTAENLEIIKKLCPARVVMTPEPCENLSKPCEEHPVENPFPERAEEPTNTKISKTDVKAICLKLSKEGKQDFLKQTFAKFGAKKLTEIAESDYAALMEELGNA